MTKKNAEDKLIEFKKRIFYTLSIDDVSSFLLADIEEDIEFITTIINDLSYSIKHETNSYIKTESIKQIKTNKKYKQELVLCLKKYKLAFNALNKINKTRSNSIMW